MLSGIESICTFYSSVNINFYLKFDINIVNNVMQYKYGEKIPQAISAIKTEEEKLMVPIYELRFDIKFEKVL